MCKSECKKSNQIYQRSSEIQSEAPTTSSHMPVGERGGMWDWFRISLYFWWIWVDFLHVDLQLDFYYLQGVSRRHVLVSRVAFSYFLEIMFFSPFLTKHMIFNRKSTFFKQVYSFSVEFV